MKPAPSLDWVIVGGERGSGARAMRPLWARQRRDQCHLVPTPFFFKQWGEWAPANQPLGDIYGMALVGHARAGRELDGRTWDEFPRAA